MGVGGFTGDGESVAVKRLKDGVVHINLMDDGELIKMPAEWVWETKNKIGVFGAGQMSGIGLALARIWKAGEHHHTVTEEAYVVIKGHGTVYLDGVSVPLRELDYLFIPPDTSHYAESEGDLYVLALTAPPWTPEDHHLETEKRA